MLLTDYQDRFQGLGQLKDVEVQIQIIDESIPPVAQPPRRLPILLQKQMDKEIENLLDLQVLEKVDKPPTWVNPLQAVQKKHNRGIRLCVDMRRANCSIIREPYQIPTLDKIRHKFNNCKVFSTLDLNQGYHQITLSKQSRDLTAFVCNKGIMRYTSSDIRTVKSTLSISKISPPKPHV